MLYRKVFTTFLLFSGMMIAEPLLAEEVPVIDVTQEEGEVSNLDSTDSSVSTGSVEQRLAHVEKQMASRSQIDLMSQVEQLQQQVQELRGQLEVQAHDLKALQDQQRAQYQDLDQRLARPAKQMSPGSSESEPAKTAGDEKQGVDVQPAQEISFTGKTVSLTNASDRTTETRKTASATGDDLVYHNAYKLLREKKYDQAKPALKKFLKDYPRSSYTVNAHYWLGEIALLQGQPDEAITEFAQVVKGNPSQTKLAEANLKLGFALYDKGQWQKARDQLSKVKQQFPGSSSAQQAESRLKEMVQDGH